MVCSDNISQNAGCSKRSATEQRKVDKLSTVVQRVSGDSPFAHISIDISHSIGLELLHVGLVLHIVHYRRQLLLGEHRNNHAGLLQPQLKRQNRSN